MSLIPNFLLLLRFASCCSHCLLLIVRTFYSSLFLMLTACSPHFLLLTLPIDSLLFVLLVTILTCGVCLLTSGRSDFLFLFSYRSLPSFLNYYLFLFFQNLLSFVQKFECLHLQIGRSRIWETPLVRGDRITRILDWEQFKTAL